MICLQPQTSSARKYGQTMRARMGHHREWEAGRWPFAVFAQALGKLDTSSIRASCQAALVYTRKRPTSKVKKTQLLQNDTSIKPNCIQFLTCPQAYLTLGRQSSPLTPITSYF
jgi:hypothetical protein